MSQTTIPIENAAVDPASRSLRLRPGRGVLVLDHHGFGNVVMSLPFLESLARSGLAAGGVYVLLATPAHYELIKENGHGIIPVYLRDYRSLAGMWRLRRLLRGKIDLVIGVPQVPLRIIIALKLLLGARFASGEGNGMVRRLLSHPVEKGPVKSILETQVEMLRDLGVESVNAAPVITLTAAEREWAGAELARAGLASARPLIGLHASAEKANKRWPAERFGAAIAALQAKYPQLSVISFGSAAEQDDANTARRVVPATPWLEGTGTWTLRQSAALMQRCEIVLCGDTGLMHIAAAVGRRTVSVFGPTSPERLAPPGAGQSWVKPATPCHPCYGQPGYPDCRCIRTISPDSVATKAIGLLAR